MTTPKLTQADLDRFTGTENWYCHGINRNVLFTDGAKFLADRAGAYWLLDEIAIIQPYDKRVAAEEFQVWKLAVRPDRSATLSCEDGNGNRVFSKDIGFTDFPARGGHALVRQQRHLSAGRTLIHGCVLVAPYRAVSPILLVLLPAKEARCRIERLSSGKGRWKARIPSWGMLLCSGAPGSGTRLRSRRDPRS